MSAPLVPSPLDFIGRKQFAFYPAIRRIEHNLWLLGASSWSEVQVINAKTGSEIWIPRLYIGAVSDNYETLLVGLTQQVELRNGEIVPQADRRVIEMPLPKDSASDTASGPAQVIGIRLERKACKTFHKGPFRIGIALLFVAGLLVLVQSISR